jgi:hypothetical protein
VTRNQWLTPVILATQEAEIRRITVRSPYLEKPYHKNWAGGVAQGEGPEFNPQYHRNKNKKNILQAITRRKKFD